MPLVVSFRAKEVVYAPDEAWLRNVLSRSDFNGHSWAQGDLVLFENRTAGRLHQDQGKASYTWSDPTPLSFTSFKAHVMAHAVDRREEIVPIDNWEGIFQFFRSPRKKRHWWQWWRR